MDNSPIYIKMCEKAYEIQRLWKPKAGDIGVCPKACFDYFKSPSVLLTVECELNKYRLWFDVPDDNYISKESSVWLPTQAQLQEMVKDPYIHGQTLACGLYHWIQKHDPREPMSMEQLWLAFVMFEKYNKTWNGEKWIPQNQS